MRGARTSHVRTLPLIMYGTAWKEDRTQALVLEAIATGFRAFDTANQRKHYVEEEVGAAVRTAIASGTVSPLQTDSLPFVSKIYWPENADDAIMVAP